MPSSPDVFEALERATQCALTIAESGDPARLSGTYQTETLQLSGYLLQE